MIGEMSFAVRTTGEPTALAATVRQVVRELDSNLPIIELGTQTARSQATLGQGTLVCPASEFLRRTGTPAGGHRTLWCVGLFGGPTHE